MNRPRSAGSQKSISSMHVECQCDFTLNNQRMYYCKSLCDINTVSHQSHAKIISAGKCCGITSTNQVLKKKNCIQDFLHSFPAMKGGFVKD